MADPQSADAFLGPAASADDFLGPAPESAAKTAVDTLYTGPAEAAANVSTAMIAKPISDIAGLAATAYDAVTGNADGNPGGFKQYVQDALTYSPRTGAGQATANALAMPGKAVGWLANATGKFYGDTLKAAGASDAVASAVQDGITEATVQAANLAGVLKAKAPTPLTEAETLNSQNVAAGQALGYKIPPSMIARTGLAGRVLEGIGGAANVVRGAKLDNQLVHNNLAAGDLGLESGQSITQEALDQARQQEYDNGYKPIRSLGRVNVDFQHQQLVADIRNGVDLSITSDAGKAALGQLSDTLLPKYSMNPTTLTMDAAFDSSALVDKISALRARAGELYQSGEGRVGKAYRLAATGLESLIDRSAQSAVDAGTVDSSLLDNYRASRTQLAKINDVENSTNLTTGNVDAIKLGRIHDKSPNLLTGGLRQIAAFANAFPEVARVPTRAASVTSPIDMGLAEGAAGLAGGGLGKAAVSAVAVGAGRGIARSVSLKPWAQKSITSMVNQNLQNPGTRAITYGSPLAFNSLVDTTQQDETAGQ